MSARWRLFLVACSLGLASLQAVAQVGLRVGQAEASWPRWQARIGVSTSPAGGSTSLMAGPLWSNDGLQLRGAQVLGDYYFGRFAPSGHEGYGSGFRATSGLLIGPRGAAVALAAPASGLSVSSLRSSAAASPDDGGAMPYLGVGYTGLSVKGFSFTADLGLVGRNSGGGLRLRQAGGTAQGTYDLLREMRVEPLLQLGVSYSF